MKIIYNVYQIRSQKKYVPAKAVTAFWCKQKPN